MRHAVCIVAAIVALGASSVASARTQAGAMKAPLAASDVPKQLEGVDVNEQLGTKLPLDLSFHDEHGKPVVLGDLINGELPVILTFNYASCPMLCSLQLGGLTDAFIKMKWRIGENFRVITVDLDPTEPPKTLRATKKRYLDRLSAPKGDEGWRFISGSDETVHALADAVGYGYKYRPDKKDYAHPAVSMVVAPDGEVTGYLYGVSFEPDKVRSQLDSAVRGEPQESKESFILTCCYWIRDKGIPALANMIMNYAAGFCALAFLGIFGVFLVRMRRKEKSES